MISLAICQDREDVAKKGAASIVAIFVARLLTNDQ